MKSLLLYSRSRLMEMLSIQSFQGSPGKMLLTISNVESNRADTSCVTIRIPRDHSPDMKNDPFGEVLMFFQLTFEVSPT